MANFTPQEIEQFLQEFFDVVGARQYVGARYVPIFGRAGEDTVEWDDTAPYEPLTVVMHDGVSYVSRRYVPTGIQISDTAYWVETYRFNAQVEQYRQEVLSFQSQIDDLRNDLEDDYVPFPDTAHFPKYGTIGQVLSTLANGTTKWEDPVVPSDAQAEAVITEWLNDHPEVTTTVQDGSITDVKINASSFIPRSNSSSGITDLNDATRSGVYTFASILSSDVIYNFPEHTNGILCVFKSQNNVIMQVYMVAAKTTMYYRMNWGGGSSDWGSWHRFTVDPYGSERLTDLDNGTSALTMYRYNSSSGNAPTTNEGNLFVFGNGADNLVQIAVDSSGSFYGRRKWGSTWDSWTDFIPNLKLTYFNKDQNTEHLSDLDNGTDSPCAYRYAQNATNAPTTNEGNLFVFGNGADNKAQIAVDSSGSFYGRRKWGSTWSSWTAPLKLTYFNKSQDVADRLTNLDNGTDSPCVYRYAQNATNAPTTNEGNLFVFGNGADNKVQIAVDSSANFYMRRRWGSWGAWKNVTVDLALSYFVKSAFLTDLNDAVDSPCSYRYESASNRPSNNPGNVFTFGNAADNKAQLAIDSDGNFYVRRKWGSSFGAWKTVETYTSKPEYTISPANLATIPQIGVIGDSYASGEIYLDSNYHDIYEQSWPQIIAKNKGITVYNYSQGGMTAKSFIEGTGERQMQGLLNSTKRNLYVIVLGINDDKSAAGIGTASDIGTNADTFYGNYSRIIEYILTYSPHSKIVIVAPANNTSDGYQRLNTALDTIATHYSIPIIKEYEYDFFKSTYYSSTMTMGHPNPSSYGGMANALTEMLEKCMADNYSYFYDVNYYDLSS